MKFQRDAMDKIAEGEHTIISSPTGTGKTEAFIIPIIDKIKKEVLDVPPKHNDECKFKTKNNHIHGGKWNKDPKLNIPICFCECHNPYALLVYPLRDLADDQVEKIGRILEHCKMPIDAVRALHGGIDNKAKEGVFENPPKILATTFDYINWHLTFAAPNGDSRFRKLIKPAKVIVMDESHSYTSYHGTNVHYLLKRMKKHMTPQYIGSSATLDNPKEFFCKMFDLPEKEVELIPNKERRKRDLHEFFIMPKNQMDFMVNTTVAIAKKKHQLLVFNDTHDNTEVLADEVRMQSNDINIKSHYAALKSSDRRMYTKYFKAGDIDVLSCTPTLELGMDIGNVDAVISAFTNDYDKFVQRIGRAGRRGKKSYGITVFRPDGPISHYYSKYIDRYWNQKHNVEIQTSNPVIQNLHKEAEEGKWAGMDRAFAFPFRDTAGEVVTSLGGHRVIPIAYYKLHQNAIYRWNNRVYRSKGLKKDGEKIVADLEIASTNDNSKKTSPIIVRNFILQKELELPKTRKSYSINFCLVKIEHEITGYKEGHKKAKFGDMVEGGPIEHWKWPSEHLAVKIKFSDLSASGEDPILHTIIHLLDNASKIITKAEANDVQGRALGGPGEFYLYDDTANGQSGYSKLIFDNFDRILEKAKELVKQDCCNEPGGCKQCTFTTSWCPKDNEGLDKAGAKNFFNDLKLS